jgi:hypothetical protein
MVGKSRIYLWLSLLLLAICAAMLGLAMIQTLQNELLLIKSPTAVIPNLPGYPADMLQAPHIAAAHRANISHFMVLFGALVVAVLSAVLIRNAINGRLVSIQSIKQNKAVIWILLLLMPLKIFSDSEQHSVGFYLDMIRVGKVVFHAPDFVQVDWGMLLIIPLALALSCLLHEAISMQGELEGTI